MQFSKTSRLKSGEKVAKNPVEKIASNPVTSVAVMGFSALNNGLLWGGDLSVWVQSFFACFSLFETLADGICSGCSFAISWLKGWVALAERPPHQTRTAFRGLHKSLPPSSAVRACCEHNEHEVKRNGHEGKEQEVQARTDRPLNGPF